MTKTIGTVLLALVLLGTLAACGHGDLEDRIEAPFEAMEAAMEAPFEAAEAAMEGAVDRALSGNAGDIGAEQAKALALERAGFAESEVSGLRADYELDDGVPRYDVSFRQGLLEYDIDIHAETGAVLGCDVDD